MKHDPDINGIRKHDAMVCVSGFAGVAAAEITKGQRNNSIDMIRMKKSLREQDCIISENGVCKVRRI